jgi:predicted amidophosphoribosyltransferase
MPAQIRNCRRCYKLFQDYGTGVCPECVRELDEIFVKVREKLYDDPRANIVELCEDTGATEQDIMGWLREGRLIMGSESARLITCVKCGAPIATGRFCEKCSQDMASQFAGAAAEMSQKIPQKTGEGGLHVQNIIQRKQP